MTADKTNLESKVNPHCSEFIIFTRKLIFCIEWPAETIEEKYIIIITSFYYLKGGDN